MKACQFECLLFSLADARPLYTHSDVRRFFSSRIPFCGAWPWDRSIKAVPFYLSDNKRGLKTACFFPFHSEIMVRFKRMGRLGSQHSRARSQVKRITRKSFFYFLFTLTFPVFLFFKFYSSFLCMYMLCSISMFTLQRSTILISQFLSPSFSLSLCFRQVTREGTIIRKQICCHGNRNPPSPIGLLSNR